MLAQYSIEFLSDDGMVESTVGITYGEDLCDIVNRLVDWYGEQICDLRIMPLENVIDNFEVEGLETVLKFD